MKKSRNELEKATRDMSKTERDQAMQAHDSVDENVTKGLIQVTDHLGSDLNLTGWKLTQVLDDILMCQFVDISPDGNEILRGGLWVPIHTTQQAWRIAKVILKGPRAKVKEGQFVVFPSTFGLKVNNLNDMKHIVFLNEDRIFGVAEQVPVK